MDKDLTIAISNILRNNKQFNNLNNTTMSNDNDTMSDIEFQQWIDRVTEKATTDEINKQIEKEAGI